MTRAELLARLDDPDPAWRAHARGRLALLDGAEPPPATDTLAARMTRCRHWSPGTCCSGGWSCRLDPDELRAVTLVECSRCPELPPP